jgi:hypothetical protein
VRYLLVNADDFGQTPGIDHGIAEAHERGIVTPINGGCVEAAVMSGMEAARAISGEPHRRRRHLRRPRRAGVRQARARAGTRP